ncbi:hypothetical protein [Roseibacillus ishigakijimensis]|uniref:Lipoprotein n=1 Tax=Roseibacillus ishigakijimensis TaxID=454146 RepID=A0A934RP38_9BACT|nr:hypothetical protein [Roseibacillus ishigakijimensis]MBK1832888.1 hypothetical protein [Roseibacillus ishigakijimensis]
MKSHLSALLAAFATSLLSLPLAAEQAEALAAVRPAYHETLLQKLLRHEGVLPPSNEVYNVRAMFNRESVIPPQCYTKNHETFNACYVCHQAGIAGRENVMNDDDLQAEYSFSDVGMINHWQNLFEDRSARIAAMSDEEILAYINQDNYSELAERLRAADFQGWIPELKDLQKGTAAFDEFGFAKDGSQWVAFNYKPFPSTFWPTNGSTDDIMIRLGEKYRQTAAGEPSLAVYRANLALLEANIKGLSRITCLPVDEEEVGVDLDGDGTLGTAHEITVHDRWVGAAQDDFKDTFLYPAGTEFLHTVRYLGFADNGEITVSPRMKEVRYMKKWRGYGKPTYGRAYEEEGFEKEAGHLPGYQEVGAHGLDNKNGWSIAGFIEGYNGRLRALTHEENFSCMGCHNSIGSTIDKTFGFPRKVEGAKGWGYINLKNMPDVPTRGEEEGEFLTYLKRVGGGSEFRNNEEMTRRWFREDQPTVPDEKKLAAARDVYDLITPSRERALQLNKAYKTIVEDQDYIYGKDAILTPPENVFERIDNETATTLPVDKQYRWDILLDWSALAD